MTDRGRPGGVAEGMESAIRPWPEQIPAISGDIHEDDDLPVRLVPWLAEELDPHVAHPVVGGGEVVDPQEEPDAPGELVADGARLLRAVGLSQQQRTRRSGRPHDNPLLDPAVIGQGRRVLEHLRGGRVPSGKRSPSRPARQLGDEHGAGAQVQREQGHCGGRAYGLRQRSHQRQQQHH
jgi:hypothetical protein